MQLLADTIVLLLWSIFFVATFLGVYDEYRRNKSRNSRSLANTQPMVDDDPVYLIEPRLHDHVA